jgi:hypothetical protein
MALTPQTLTYALELTRFLSSVEALFVQRPDTTKKTEKIPKVAHLPFVSLFFGQGRHAGGRMRTERTKTSEWRCVVCVSMGWRHAALVVTLVRARAADQGERMMMDVL